MQCCMHGTALHGQEAASEFHRISILNAPCVQPRHFFCPRISLFRWSSHFFNVWPMGSSLEKGCILGQTSIKAAVETGPVEKYQIFPKKGSSNIRFHRVSRDDRNEGNPGNIKKPIAFYIAIFAALRFLVAKCLR